MGKSLEFKKTLGGLGDALSRIIFKFDVKKDNLSLRTYGEQYEDMLAHECAKTVLEAGGDTKFKAHKSNASSMPGKHDMTRFRADVVMASREELAQILLNFKHLDQDGQNSVIDYLTEDWYGN